MTPKLLEEEVAELERLIHADQDPFIVHSWLKRVGLCLIDDWRARGKRLGQFKLAAREAAFTEKGYPKEGRGLEALRELLAEGSDSSPMRSISERERAIER